MIQNLEMMKWLPQKRYTFPNFCENEYTDYGTFLEARVKSIEIKHDGIYIAD